MKLYFKTRSTMRAFTKKANRKGTDHGKGALKRWSVTCK